MSRHHHIIFVMIVQCIGGMRNMSQSCGSIQGSLSRGGLQGIMDQEGMSCSRGMMVVMMVIL